MEERRRELVRVYFSLGFEYKDITHLLAKDHGIILSERHLKRILRSMSLFRRSNYTRIAEVIDFITDQLRQSGQRHGYRWMHQKCIQCGLIVKQDTVRSLLRVLDPDGVEFRSRHRLHRRVYSSKGPNFLWHMDSYDKLSPYGICINGCIDGFSRKLIWLEAAKTNSDPRVIAGYYVISCRRLQGRPMCIRTDMGTENVKVVAMQEFLSETHPQQFPCNLRGTSQHNQRIECWWGMLRRQTVQFWMSLFHDLKSDGYFSGDLLDKSLIQFCFLHLIKEDLVDTQKVWNAHRIRPTMNSAGGRPSVMFSLPEVYDTRDYLCPIDPHRLDACATECTFMGDAPPCDEDVHVLCNMYMEENALELPSDAFTASNLYLKLREYILSEL